jgi:ATP-dependent DNA helicase RecG
LGLAAFGTGVLRLQKAAMLLFAKDVSHWHPRCQVRVIRVRGTELKTGRDYHVISDETAQGNILQLITDAWEKLRPHLVETKMTTLFLKSE